MNKLHFNPFAAPLRFVKGRGREGEIALQHGRTGPELAEGVKTGSGAAGGLLEPPHYTAVVAVGVTTRRVAGEVGSRRVGRQT